jgi:hypothetical protein
VKVPPCFDVVRRDTRRTTSLLRAVLVGALVACIALVGAPLATANATGTLDPAGLRKQEWYLGVLGLDHVWPLTKGAGVTVAVLDRGVDASVGDLQGALVPGFDATGKGGDPAVANDDEGHGTLMAVRIAGRGINPGIIGIAPQAKVLPVLIPAGLGDGSDEANALNRLSSRPHPPQVVNMSIGSAGPCPPLLQSAVKTAVDKGLILVASAGNEAQAGNPTQYPANCKGVIAVGAYDKTGTPWAKSERQPYVALGAPGVDLPAYTKQRVLGTSDGTSDAAAIVSGSFALLRAKFPTMPSRQLVARMLATASTKYFKGPGYGQSGDVLGFGFAVVHQAIIRSVPANAPNPIYDDLARIDAPPSSDAAGSASSPPAGGATTVHVSFPGGSHPSSSKPGSSSTGLWIGLGAAALAAAAIAAWALARRGRRSGPATPPAQL